MLKKKYLKAGVGAIVCIGLGAILNLAALWLTTNVLDKSEFGDFAIALTLIMALVGILGAGAEGVVLYRCSRPESFKGSAWAYVSNSLYLAAALCLIAAFLVFTLAHYVEEFFGKVGMAGWLQAMAIIVFLDPLRVVLVSWHHANQNSLLTAILRDSTPHAFRCITVGGVAAGYAGGGEPQLAVASAYVLAVLLSLCVAIAVSPKKIWRPTLIYSGWDYKYFFKLQMTGIVSRPRQSIDVFLVGALASSTATADYMIASRLAQLPSYIKQAAEILLVPRLGMLLGQRQRVQIEREFGAIRRFVFIVCLVTLGLFILAGDWVLKAFGDGGYHAAYAPLLILAAATVFKGAFGASGQFLKISGYAGWTLWAAVAGFVVLVLVGVLSIPNFGATGGAFAQICSAVANNIVVAVILYFHVKFRSVDITTSLFLFVSFCSVTFSVLEIGSPFIWGSLVVSCAFGLGWSARGDINDFARIVVGRLSRN